MSPPSSRSPSADPFDYAAARQGLAILRSVYERLRPLIREELERYIAFLDRLESGAGA